ncbi:spermidine/putrescine ABC transporter substrate-binding protein [Rhizobium sp. YIM 134829]|uniref:polyamine ABC transporter substrate-binding protein n=1 Tax=Rhizobium sp. YIM 134829 TaxID=3390453 RepID=UPI00397A3499
MSLLKKAACIAAILCAAGPVAEARPLNLLIWESYIDPSILKDFTAKTGIEVNQVLYDSGDARDEILADPRSNIDLSVVGENSAALFGKRGVLAPLDAANVPALADYDTTWKDRCVGYGVPYLSGTMGILYRSDKVTRVPTSWNDLMKPDEALRRHIAMYDDHNEAFIAPLVLLGKSINANDAESLKAAFTLMKAQAPYVLTYDYVITAIQNPTIGKDIFMALGYSGDQKALNDKAGAQDLWRYAVPKEGTLSWLDCISVMQASPQKADALALVEFIASAPNAARNAEALDMPTASLKALPLIPETMRNNPAIYVPAEILSRSQYQTTLSVQSVQTRRRIISSMANYQ